MKTLIILFMLSGIVAAQERPGTVDTVYFHPAASMYIHGNAAGASNLVAQGLSQYPEDGKLLRLKELIEQQQEQQQDKDKQDQNQDQNQDQQPDQNNDQQPNENQNQDQQPQGEPDQPQNEEPQPEPPRAEQMSQDEAEQLLDAMKQEEETKRLQLHPVMGRPVPVEKDW